jgi:hypothetical protein
MGTRRVPPVRPRSARRLPPRSVMRRTAGPRAAVSNTPSTRGCRSRPSTSTSISALTASRAAPSPACRSRCLRRRPSTPSRSVSTSSLVGGSPVGLPNCCEPSTETPQPRTFPFEPPSNLGFDHSRRLVRPPQASNRGLLDRQCHCASAPAVVHLLPPDIAEDRAAKGPKPKALIRSPFRAALARKEGTVLLCLQPEFAMFRIGQHCCPNFWPTRASRGLSASG